MRTAVTVLAVTLALPLVGCERGAPASALERVKAAGVLRWGGDLAGGEPYVYEDPSRPGQLLGFEVELVQAIARELGVRAEFRQNEWSQLVPSIERGGFDLLLNGFEVTPRNGARLRLSRPYFAFAERLVARAGDSRIAAITGSGPSPSLAPLRPYRVGTLANSMAESLLRAAGVTQVLLYDGVDTPYDDLASGRSDAVLLDDIIADRYAAVHKNLAPVADLAIGYYGAAVRPADEDLGAAVDAALDRIARRGELRRILETYHLWQPREEELVDWSPERTRALLAAALPAAGSRSSERSGAGGATHRLDGHDLVLFLQGAGWTLLISTLAMGLAVPLGLLLALARLYGGPLLRAPATAYIEIYRGTPVLLQLYVIYFGIAEVVRLPPLAAAVIGLGMNYAAYEAEVYRAGLQAVPRGQLEAALALGMRMSQALRRVVLPQALRNALPAVTNDFIALLKDSSLVSVITVVELTKRTQIAAVETRSWVLPGLLCAALYFAMSYPLSHLARRLEARLARG